MPLQYEGVNDSLNYLIVLSLLLVLAPNLLV